MKIQTGTDVPIISMIFSAFVAYKDPSVLYGKALLLI